ncbi:hypothetical protein FACS1894103_7050 [Campylobacterota bacterium]|nr:hypothetical protein FACS1894103_7050 [Campylobacterota bacterium]
MGQIGNKRADRRPAKLPKDEAKQARELRIREWAANNDCSIEVARAYWAEDPIAVANGTVVEAKNIKSIYTSLTDKNGWTVIIKLRDGVRVQHPTSGHNLAQAEELCDTLRENADNHGEITL